MKEVDRLERWWATLLDTYEAAFGAVAAEAFGNYVRVGHAGVPIVVQPAFAEPNPIVPVLPSPRPLPQSVLAGVFGTDEDGCVDPSDEEVRDITCRHAEMVIDLSETFRRSSRIPGMDPQRAGEKLQIAVQQYAEDFGETAANRLLSYCQRQALLNETDPAVLRHTP